VKASLDAEEQVAIKLDVILWLGRESSLGLILQSTNGRSPFELPYAMRETVRRYIGGDVRALVSSEWTYTAFT
jgi:hypothetical protein